MKLSRSMWSRLIGALLILLVFSSVGTALGLAFHAPLWKASIVWPIEVFSSLCLISACVMAVALGFYMLCTGDN